MIKQYLKDKFDLGYVYDKDGLCAHRTMLKIIINPFLRSIFGYAVASNIENEKFTGYTLIKTGRLPFKFSCKWDGERTKII